MKLHLHIISTVDHTEGWPGNGAANYCIAWNHTLTTPCGINAYMLLSPNVATGGIGSMYYHRYFDGIPSLEDYSDLTELLIGCYAPGGHQCGVYATRPFGISTTSWTWVGSALKMS